MRNNIKKLLCAALCVVTVGGVALTPACSNYHDAIKLSGDISGTITSNGGFAVQKGNYVYFVNGVESNTANNAYGEVTKGAIMRISTADFTAHDYDNAQTVVPQIFYTPKYTAGLFIHGDYVYYSTPATDRNSDGDVQNNSLDFKRTKLDGSESMKDFYYQAAVDTFDDYRFVAVGDKVYLLFAAKETLDGTNSYTNIRSIDLATGENTLLAYNVSSYLFDKTNVTNPYVYYTMNVTEGIGTDNATTRAHNQIYRVKADQKLKNEYDFSAIKDYDAAKDPVYVNCGKLILDGIGATERNYPTQFNAFGKDATQYTGITHKEYTYALTSYTGGTLYYTRKADVTSLCRFTDAEADALTDAVAFNTPAGSEFVKDAESVTDYTFIEVGSETKALFTDNNRFMVGKVENGKVEKSNCFPITDDAASAAPSLMFTEGSYLYYSISGTNDNAIYRVDYTGDNADYNVLDASENVTEYKSVKLLDIEYNSSWYLPEVIAGQLLFSSKTDKMNGYNYIMAFDLTDRTTNTALTNANVKELNKQYEDVTKKIDEIDAETYKNLSNALKYAFYTVDEPYLAELIQAYVDISNKEEEYLYSKESAQIYLDFCKAEGDWASYNTQSKKVNGKDVYANSRDYYYAVVGKMTDADKDAYITALKDAYMQAYPVAEEEAWWDTLTTTEQVWFIIGMCAAGLVVIAGITVGVLYLVKRLKKNKPVEEKAQKRQVDVTDDTSIDVYADENEVSAQDEQAEQPQDTDEQVTEE